MVKKAVFLIFLAALWGSVEGAFAGTVTWTNAYPWSRLWHSVENWDPPTLPGRTDEVYINSPPEYGPAIDSDVNVLDISGPRYNSDSNQVMDILAGTVAVNGRWEFGNGGSGTATINIANDPRITVEKEIRHREGKAEIYISDSASLKCNDRFRVADLGSAILEISGEPNIVIAGDLTGGYSSGAWFEAHVLGGTVSVGGCFQVGNEGSGLIEISGGTVECRTLKLQVRADESSGTLDVSGGRVHIHETLQVNDGNGLATMNMRGGQVNAGQLELARGSGSGTLKVTGGLLWVGGALAAPANGNGTATILLDDGTVECSWFTHAAGYIMDINEGILIIGGDARETILEDVNAGYIRPRHSIGEILVDYNNINAGRTTVWAAPHLEAVPDVIGLTLGAAETKLSQVGLVVGALAEEYDDFAPAGTVTSQDPNAGAVIPMGSSVNVVVSLGRPIVPNVVAKSLTDANTAIVSVDNLKVGTIIWQYNDDVAPSVVISQEPVGETPVPIGSTVDLVLSLGQPAVPNVTKLPEAEAVATIESIDNLTATVSYAHHDTVEEGHVISQSPAGGKAVPIGSNVGIVVSLGRPVVPNVIGRTQAYAATAIEAVSLVVGTVTWQFSDTVTTGIVLSQFPVGGTTVPVGQHVNLVVSLGRPAVPNVVGLSQFNATTMIKSVDNLSVGTVSQQYSNTVPSGDVIDQNPADGTRVLIGSTVDLIVSLGRPVVPHVCGWFEAEAVAAIRGVDNLDAAVTYAYDDTVPQGKVVSQHPAGETAVDIGTTVNIVVSLGRPEVPDVTGRTESEARPAITAVDNLKIGAVVYEYRDTITAGLVISQNPAGHTMVPVGSSVDLVVSLGRPEVPDVVGRTESEARLAITAVDNLTVNTVTYRYCDTVPTGVVTAQSPVGHTKVPIGSSVELVVSLGQPEVPNVVTMSEADARLAITAVDNLQIGNVTYEYSDSVGVGLVISQSPAGYTRVPIGSSVELVVSLGQPEVPNVLGMNVSGASSAITAAGLTVGTLTYEYSDTVPSGLIIGQDPPGETAAPVGTEVDLVVSLGRPAAPYVIGMTLTAATTKIESVDNLTVGAVTDQYSSTVAAGLVMNQDPSQGTRVQIGSTVDLVISLGRPMVPYVVGMTEAAARTAIEAVETLTVGTISREYSNTAEVGRVISQNPAGGTAAPVGSTVDLVISLGQPVVPNIVGQTEGRAAAAIHAIDNLATDLTYEYRDSTPEGIVMSQDPVGGTTVVIGTTVSLVVSLGQPPSVVLGGYRLVELQNSDGGWDWPSDDGDPTRGSDPYTFASVAMGLAQSYRHSRQTSEPNMLAALQNAKTFLLSKTHNFVSSDGAIAVELDGVLGGTESTNYVRSNFFDRLAAGTYADARSVLFDCNTAEYVQAQRERYGSGFANLGAWEMGLGLYGAHAIGASTSEWIAGLEAEIDELDGSQVHDVLGLAGAVFGLAAAGEDYDPQSGEHAAASGLRDLAEILAGYQLDTGGFPWWGMSSGEGSEAVEETAYGLMALSQFDRVGYSAEIRDGRTYLQSVRLQTGGWENYPGWGEDNEITAEALLGIAAASFVVGDFDNDGRVNLADFAIFASAWQTETGDLKWNPECDINTPADASVDMLDLAVFVSNWLLNVFE